MRSAPARFLIAVSLCLSACSGNSSNKLPTAPTTAIRVATESPAASQHVTATSVDWSCFANGGITSAAFGAGRCTTARVTTLRLGTATAAALTTPAAPAGLTAAVSGSVVTLNWTAPATGDAPTSYVVEAGSATGRADLASFDTGSTATSLAIFNVPAGTYFVRIRAVNSAGTSDASNEFQVVVGGAGPCTSVSAPSFLSGTVTGSTVALTWNAPGGCAPSSYVIQAGSASGLSNLANFNTGSAATVFTAAGVGPGTYFIRVLSNAGGVISTPSNEIAVTVGSCGVVPNAPQNARASASGSTVTVAWDPPLGGCSPSSYILEAGSTSGATNIAVTTVTGTSLTATNVGNGTYFIRIRAANALGQSATSNEVVLTVGATTPVPLVVGFQFFDPATQAGPVDTCRIRSGTASTCTLNSTSFPTGTNGIVLYEWTVQYFYGTSKTLTQSGTSATFSFSDTCGGPGSSSDGALQVLSVTLTVTDNLGNKATAVSGTGSQPPLQLKLFTC